MVLLTGGPTNNIRCSSQFKRRGMVVKLSGDHPDREVLFLRTNDTAVLYQKAYKKSRAKKDDFLWINRMHLLIPHGEPVFMEGNETTLTRSLIRAGFSGRYNISEAKGWVVKIDKELKVDAAMLTSRVLHIAIKSTDLGLLRFKVGNVRTGNLPVNFKDFIGIVGYQIKGARNSGVQFFSYETKNVTELERKYKALEQLLGVIKLSSKEILDKIDTA